MAKALKCANIQFDAEELDRIDAAARDAGMSRAAFVKTACRELIKRQERRSGKREV